MKKILRTILFVVFVSAIFVLFSSCGKDNLVSISLSGKEEILVGNFDYSDYILSLTYESGKTEEIVLDKSMLTSEDNMKFYHEGEHVITVNYGGQSCDFKFTACLYEFDNLIFSDVETVYNGQTITVEVEKNYPEGTTVYYPDGNTFINAGEYRVYAIVSRRNYVTKKLSAKVTIKKADYDMSGVVLNDKVEEYDGSYHTLSVLGTLPTGVTASYSVEKITKNGDSESAESLLNVNVINAGEYKYTVKFLSNNKNYNDISPLSATLIINKKSYNTQGLAFDDVECLYDGKEHTIEVTNLPDGVNVEYSAYVIDGEDKVELSSVSFVNANTYHIVAHFYSNDINYEEISPMTAILKINPTEYDLDNVVYLTNNTITYDGQPHHIEIRQVNGDVLGLPDGLTVLLETYEKDGISVYKTDANGEYITDDSGNKIFATDVTDAGVYQYTLVLQCDDSNYEINEPLTACLTINKADYDKSEVLLKKTNFEYDGNPINIREYIQVPSDTEYELYCYKMVDGEKDTEVIKDEDGNPTEKIVPENNGINSYYVEIRFTKQNTNYNDLGTIIKVFSVTKKGSVV